MSLPLELKERLNHPGRTPLAGLLDGQLALVLPEFAKAVGPRGLVLVCRDDQHLASVEEQLEYFAPELEMLRFPAWDSLPYDRVSPVADILAQRLATLARLQAGLKTPYILLTTVNAVLQRTVPQGLISNSSFHAKPGTRISLDALQAFVTDNGYSRVGTVIEKGDFAVRGGLIDLFPPGAEVPVRLDFFGDTLESIRSFDAQSQRSLEQLKELRLNPANEVLLTKSAIAHFRTAYAEAFGGLDMNDPLYESITSSRRYQGMEHWLPLFHSSLATLFEYVPEAVWFLTHEVEPGLSEK